MYRTPNRFSLRRPASPTDLFLLSDVSSPQLTLGRFHRPRTELSRAGSVRSAVIYRPEPSPSLTPLLRNYTQSVANKSKKVSGGGWRGAGGDGRQHNDRSSVGNTRHRRPLAFTLARSLLRSFSPCISFHLTPDRLARQSHARYFSSLFSFFFFVILFLFLLFFLYHISVSVESLTSA